MYQFDWKFIWGEPGLLLLHGFVVTLQLSFWALALALIFGLVIGIIRWLNVRGTVYICWLYVEIARNTPPIVQILFWYFSASYIFPDWLFSQVREIGLEFGAAVFALAMYQGAFYAEIFRAGLNVIPRGQYEAARVLGLPFHSMMRHVILPQVGRIILPPGINETVALIKNTSLAMAIGVTELTFQYRHIDSYAFRGVEALTIATLLYMSTCFLVAGCGKWINTRLSRHMIAPARTSNTE